SPSGVVTTRAERTPSRDVRRFSARRMPQGSGMPSCEAPPEGARPESSDLLARRRGDHPRREDALEGRKEVLRATDAPGIGHAFLRGPARGGTAGEIRSPRQAAW